MGSVADTSATRAARTKTKTTESLGRRTSRSDFHTTTVGATLGDQYLRSLELGVAPSGAYADTSTSSMTRTTSQSRAAAVRTTVLLASVAVC